MVMNHRRQIVRACKARGWTIQPAALEGIERHLQQQQQQAKDENAVLQNVLNDISNEIKKQQNKQQQQQQQRTITMEIVDQTLNDKDETATAAVVVPKSSSRSRPAVKPSNHQKKISSQGLEIVNAFETPRLVYEAMRKQFRVEEKRWPLFGTAEDKTNMLAQRYALIHQRLLRHPLFRPTHLAHSSTGGSSSSASQHKLTPIESLLGGGSSTSRSNTSSVLLLGILIQIEEGQYYLEDLTGQVPVSFQETVSVDGFFVTEQCILLVEGIFQDGIFYVDRLGHPLLEKRETSLQAIQQQVSHPAFVSRKLSIKSEESSSFIVLSDVHLDQPQVQQQLEALFAIYENYSPQRLPCFVLMGNFCSPNNSHQSQQNQQHFLQHSVVGHGRTSAVLEELVSLIEKFPNLAHHAHFCLVPGPNDYGLLGSTHLHVLPLPPLDKVMKTSLPNTSHKIANLHHASNPCRIRWAGQEIVVFRYDLLHLMQLNQVLLRQQQQQTTTTTKADDSMEDDNNDDEDNHHRLPHCRLIKTILDQGHLLPVSNVPVYWNYDSALRLYPLPDAVILGGDGTTSQPYHELYEGCNVFHPGSFVPSENKGGSNYAVFTLGNEDDDISESSDPLNEKGAVEFMQVGGLINKE